MQSIRGGGGCAAERWALADARRPGDNHPRPIASGGPRMSVTPAYSPGLEGVIAGETAISTIEGGLRYRGYAVGDLAQDCSFDDVAYLLLYGELPTAKELAQ